MSGRDRFPAVEGLVPHRGPSLMIQRVLEAGGGELRAAGRIPLESAFAAPEGAPCYVGLDLLAQAAGAVEALEHGAVPSDGGPSIGYLVGIREAHFEVRHLPLDCDLTAHVRHLDGALSLAHHAVSLDESDGVRISAVLTTFRLPRRT